MKRLIVMASAIAVAAIAQAVTVSWTSGAIYLPDTDGSWSSTKAGTAAAKKVTAYYFISSVALSDVAFDSYFDYNETSGAIALKSGKTATATIASTFAGAANASSEISEGQTLYALAFYTFTDTSKKGWYISGSATATYPTGALEATVSPENLAVTYGKTAGWTSAAPVPEPTTVALLALGLAAVGLKRKIA